MAIRVKEWTIDSENVKASLDLLQKRIEQMKKLDEVNLSDEEFLEILDFCYIYDLNVLENDIVNHSKELFGSDTVSSTIIDTNLLLYINNDTNIYVRYDGIASSSFKSKEIYTLEELESGIAKHELIIYSGSSITRYRWELSDELKNKQEINVEISKRANALVLLGQFSLLDLGIYKEWLLPIIRKQFTKERITKDILELISYAKQQIENYHQTLEQEKRKAEEIIASNDLAIGELEDFSEALNRIREKKD